MWFQSTPDEDEEILNFDEPRYATQINKMNKEDLRKEETKHYRSRLQIVMATSAAGVCFALTPFTMGASILFAASTTYAARSCYIAMKMFEFVQTELGRRKISFHWPTKRDFVIPVAKASG